MIRVDSKSEKIKGYSKELSRHVNNLATVYSKAYKGQQESNSEIIIIQTSLKKK